MWGVGGGVERILWPQHALWQRPGQENEDKQPTSFTNTHLHSLWWSFVLQWWAAWCVCLKRRVMRIIWVIKVNACQWYCLPFVLPPQPWLSVALLARLGVGPTRAVVQPLMLFALLSPAKEVLQSLPVVLPPCLMRCWGAIFWRLGRCNEVNNLCKPEAVLLLFFLLFLQLFVIKNEFSCFAG